MSLMYCTIILSLFLQCLTDIEDLISRPITLKFTLVIASNFMCIKNYHRIILDTILYEAVSNDVCMDSCCLED
jgi:hypothetical protein